MTLEAASLLAPTALTRLVLQARVRLRFADQLRIDLTGLDVSRIVPGGGPTAAALRYRLMTSAGVPAEDAASATAAEAVIAGSHTSHRPQIRALPTGEWLAAG